MPGIIEGTPNYGEWLSFHGYRGRKQSKQAQLSKAAEAEGARLPLPPIEGNSLMDVCHLQRHPDVELNVRHWLSLVIPAANFSPAFFLCTLLL